MVNVAFRKPAQSDLQDISQMITDSIEHFHSENYNAKDIEVWKDAYSPKELKKLIDKRKSLVMWVEDTCAGFIQFETSEIHSVYLNPSFMGKGLGKKLLQRMLDELKEDAHTEVKLKCTEYVKGFYENSGFIEKAPITTYWGGQPFQEYVMVKKL